MFVRATAIVFFAFVIFACADEKVINKRDAAESASFDFSKSFDVSGSPKSLDTESDSSPTYSQNRWCQLTPNVYVPQGYSFMKDACTYCQCSFNHLFLCGKLPCMNAFCVDDSTPAVPNGQCCAQCSYDMGPKSCSYKNHTIPQGALVRRTSTGVYCWCQFGAIECRQLSTSDGSGLLGDGTTVYVVIIIICVLILLGTFICVGCSVLAYYFYRKNQQTAQTATEQYLNNAGWQPMEDEETPSEEKQAEAQKVVNVDDYPNGNGVEFIPPPYAMYNGPYPSEEKQN